MIILCLMASWEMSETKRVCQECGHTFTTTKASQSPFLERAPLCSPECRRARKTRLQRERRGMVRP